MSDKPPLIKNAVREATPSRVKGLRTRTTSQQILTRSVLAGSADLLCSTDIESFCASAWMVAHALLPFEGCLVAVLSESPDEAYQVFVSSKDGPGVEQKKKSKADPLIDAALECMNFKIVGKEELAEVRRQSGSAYIPSDSTASAILLPLYRSDGAINGAFIGFVEEDVRFTDHDLVSTQMYALQLGATLELIHSRFDLRHWNAIVQSSRAAMVGTMFNEKREPIISHWNAAAERIFLYSASEAIGHPIGLIVPSTDSAKVHQTTKKLLAGESLSFETVCCRKDGTTLDVSLTVSPIRDAWGGVQGAAAILSDITEEKQERHRFRVAVESAPNAMLLSDAQGQICLVNEEAERLFGKPREALIGSNIATLFPKDVQELHETHRENFKKRPVGVGTDFWVLASEGRRLPVQIGLNPIRWGDETWVLASVVDISERHRADEERKTLLEKAQQAVHARDTFLSIASHELKTPLTALQLTVQTLLRSARKAEATGGAANDVHKLKLANRQVLRLGTLIEQLLDVSRISAGRLSLERSETKLEEVLREVIERFAPESGPAVRVRGAIPNVVGIWDAGRIDQIFTNLISNALKYGNGRPVDVTVEAGEDDVIIAVIDRGDGIAPEDQERIFERFERLVSHRHHGGFGLGLWITRQLVEAHGGTVDVESERGAGATFRVILPLKRAVTQEHSLRPEG